MGSILRVLICDSQTLVREAIQAILGAYDEFEVVGDTGEANQLLALAQTLHPDVVLLDAMLGGVSTSTLAKRLHAACPQVKVLVFSGVSDEVSVRQMFSQGVSGYVLKQSRSSQLVQAIRTVGSGHLFLDPALSPSLDPEALPHLRTRGENALSEREVEVLRLYAAGHSLREVSEHLSLSIKTVETYKSRIFRKLRLQSRVEGMRYALAQGWLKNLD